MLALAALKIVLQRATGKDDIYVGTLVAGPVPRRARAADRASSSIRWSSY